MQSPAKPVVQNIVMRNEWGSYGLETVAYIKTVTVDGQKLHSIHAADGTPLTVIAERELAYATVRQHDLEPASVH